MDKMYFVINGYLNIIFVTENKERAIEMAKKRNQLLLEKNEHCCIDDFFEVGMLDSNTELALDTTYLENDYDGYYEFYYPACWTRWRNEH